jgi:hypothetical protein
VTNYVPQQQSHPAPVYYVAPSNGMGTAALVLGIVGLVFSFIPIIGVVAWPMVILGAVFGGVGIDKAGKNPGMSKGPAIAGLTCSLVGLVICLLWTIGVAAS